MKHALVFSLVLGLAACSSVGPKVSAGAHSWIDCAKQDLAREFDGLTLLSGVADVIQRGADGWKDVLVDLGQRAGEGALACAVVATHDALAKQAPPPGSFSESRAAAGAARAQTLISEKGWRFSP